MVSSKKMNIFRVVDLEGKNESHDFDAKLSSVDIIAKKEIVGLRRNAELLEYINEIEELPVDIADYNKWRRKLKHGRFAFFMKM